MALKAVIIGAINMDVLAVAGQPAIAGDSTPGSATFCAGGVGRNVAEALTRLSINCSLYSIVGDDSTADWLLADCEQLGIDCSHVRRTVGQTPSYVAVHNDNGGLLNAINAMSLFELLHIDQLPGLQQGLIDADVAVVDANINDGVISQLKQLDLPGKFMADAVSVAKCRRLVPLLHQLSLLKVNRAEAVELTGGDDGASNDRLLTALLASGCKQVLMTLGESGSIMATPELRVQAEALPVASIDSVNGAGDSLFAGVIAAMLSGLDIADQLRWGAAAAALSLQTTRACSPHLSLEKLQNSGS